MREWGSTLFHNGMAFYLATGTQLSTAHIVPNPPPEWSGYLLRWDNSPLNPHAEQSRTSQSVAQEICRTLFEAQGAAADHTTVIAKIKSLMEYLSWSTWKECTGCKDNEMCMVPVAPMSAVEDYDHPRCRDVRNLNVSGRRYWGEFYIPSPNREWRLGL